MSTPSLSRLQAFYGHLEPSLLLRVMIREEFRDKIALVSSFGADAAVLLHMIAQADKKASVYFLETGKHFPETLAYVDQLQKQLGLENLKRLTPNTVKLQQADPDGMLWQTQPNRCCYLRKVAPLNEALESHGIQAVITGRKRYQTKDRTEMPTIELDADNRFRINPLAAWTREDTEHYFRSHGLPEHPLKGKGYLSIGCGPCTQPVKAGEDERAGRWAQTIGLDEDQKTECGIHLPATATADWSV